MLSLAVVNMILLGKDGPPEKRDRDFAISIYCLYEKCGSHVQGQLLGRRGHRSGSCKAVL
jgi:hypothetical protein